MECNGENMNRSTVIEKTAEQAQWWAAQRIQKLKEFSNETISINPFLLPLIMEIHGYENSEDLVSYMMGGHLSTSHATGFGKLIDEKILPNVFNTIKLNKEYRNRNNYSNSIFDEIDHIVPRLNNDVYLLSLKAGRWTIQLTMAVQLNKSFSEIIDLRNKKMINFKKIVIGIFYGNEENLTDKYRIARGICTGAIHDVKDITSDVDVLCGKNFWAWLNYGEQDTQLWVMQGLLDGTRSEIIKHDIKDIVNTYKKKFNESVSKYITKKRIDWNSLLNDIND